MILVFLLLFVSAVPAAACFAPPAEFTRHHGELVADAVRIAWARALEPSSPRSLPGLFGVAPRFEVIEVLKGDVPDEFTLANGRYSVGPENDDFLNSDFDGHHDLAVWDRMLTRQWNNSMCQMEPAFVPGETYLIFLDSPHWRSYEIVRSDDDLWLKAVRNLIENPSRRAGLAVTVPQWLSLGRRAFVVHIANCEAEDFRIEDILVGTAEGNWNPSEHRYRDYYGSRSDCKNGDRFLVFEYQKTSDALHRSAIGLFDVETETVDFSKLAEGVFLEGTRVGGTELEISGETRLSLDVLRKELLEQHWR